MGLFRDCFLYSKNNTKCMHTLCEQNVEFRDAKIGATNSKPSHNAVLPRAVLTIRS